MAEDKPAKPVKPADAQQAAQQEKPQPEKPAQPERSTQTEESVKPDESAVIKNSVEPEKPAQLEKPEQQEAQKMKELAVVTPDGELQKEKLETILARYWQKDRVKIVSSQVEPGTTKGTNFSSIVWRVNFSYTANEETVVKEDAVVVKIRPICTATNKLMHTTTAFTNEIFAYEHVIPTLNDAVDVPLRVPKFMHGNEYCIVLEDMKKKSFTTINKKLAVEWNQVWSALTEMAKLHAGSIVMEKIAPEKFDALVHSIIRVPVEETTPLGDRQNSSLDTILRVLEEASTPEMIKQKEMLEKSGKDSWVRQNSIVEKQVPIRVINHGSYWINNILYRKDMITLLDWQHIVYSSPALDLSYFLYVNIDSDFLTNKRQKLIDYYLVNLHQFIYDAAANKLPCEEVKALLDSLNYEWINSELQRFSLFAYMMAQWITPIFYWSEAVFQTVSMQGGIEKMSMEERMKHMTSDQRDRMIKLTKLFIKESQ